MSGYMQETDTRMIFPYPATKKANFEVAPVEQTTRGSLYAYYSQGIDRGNVISNAWLVLAGVLDIKLAHRAKTILLTLQTTINQFQSLGFAFGNFPPIDASLVEDGSILLEWIFDNFRIGFNIEEEPTRSSWYVVSNNELNGTSASGFIMEKDFNGTVLWLLNFASINT